MAHPSDGDNPIDEDACNKGPLVLAAGIVAGPPRGPFRPGIAYPVAMDIDAEDGLATVSFAALDLYPRIEPGWWCVAVTYRRDHRGGWGESGEHDNTTSPTPFVRPDISDISYEGWIDWHSNGPHYEDADGPGHGYFGIAPHGVARLTVTTEQGRERALTITPWCGAYATSMRGRTSTLTGYAADGSVLGSIQY